MKMKKKKGAKKRFSITASGKVMRRRGYSSHLKDKKSGSRLRRQAEPQIASAGDSKRLKKLLIS
ncbi:MAG: 50S ribosomal protein L35 [Candidatus Woykebacteria bacterium RIFCSPHIGHO2_12_FULL_45_10]|uniref:Large ribosomal subunit protein bL35 n=1 Tax=Candidatus Woykebacteria bacterium RIFCSPHIGHO2_12_FULL_45_10 TaxID=1802603 RepID=A0A1G1WPD0_9BACT|nr:MAG: 50S ribosomal protein L35 [Candidatus Woykebacteria bacterium RIFCSPHIGHO2_12_FULL_45_10]